jgi:hypothetical protein
MGNTEKPAGTDAPITQPRDNWRVRLIGYAKRKMDERAAKKQNEPPVDRAARVSAKATVWIALFTLVSVVVSVGTFLILKSQLKEMHDGGVDTHTLAQQAIDQTTIMRQRPWVSLTGSPEFKGISLDAKGNPQEIDVVLTLRNAGNAPAIGVVTNMHLAGVPESPPPDWAILVVRECDDAAFRNKIDERKGGDLLVPQMEIHTRKTRVRLREDSPTIEGDLFLMGCVGYYDSREKVYKEAPKYEMSFVERFVPGRNGIDGHFETQGWGDAKDPPPQKNAETKPN